MAALGFEDTVLALKMYFSGKLANDLAKPKHRDGRIVEFISSGRRRLENVTPEDVSNALTCVRSINELSYQLIHDFYKHETSVEDILTFRLVPEETIYRQLGEGLKVVAYHIVYETAPPVVEQSQV